jgi:hypothetical protein
MNRLTADDIFSIFLKFNILACLLFLSGLSYADQVKNNSAERMAFLYLSYGKTRNTCNFIEFGGALKKSYFEFKGSKDDSNDYCVVKLTETEFNDNFRYCGLSSYDHKNNGQGSCVFEPRDGGYAFLAGVPNNKDGLIQWCNFVCLTKNDGNKSR